MTERAGGRAAESRSGHRSPERRDADRLLLRAAAHGGPWLGLLAAAAVALAAAETAFPALLGHTIDAVLRHRGSSTWLLATAVLVGALVLLDALEEVAAGASAARSTAWLRTLLLRHVLDLGTRATARAGAGDLVGRLVGNCAQAGRSGQVAVRAGAALIPAIGGPVGLALIDPWLCVTFLAGVPVLLLLLRTLARDAQELAERYLTVQGEIAARLVDALRGVRTIAAAGTIDREAARVLEPLPELHRHGMGIWRAQMRISAQDGLLVALLEVAVLAVAGLELMHGRISAGELLAAAQYVLLGATMGSALSSVTALARSRAAAGRLAQLLRTEPPAYGRQRLPPGGGRLELRGVTVHDGARSTLRDVSLVVAPGTLLAVVGPSGAGKSLLSAVAGRLLDPDEGEVLLDGVPLAQLARAELRGAIGYGFERPALIGDTVADAIAFGTCRPPARELHAAARAARAHDFICRLQRRYRTPLREAPMSGGQLQRLGLARTFAHAGRVLLLDDIAASLDTVTEHHIAEALTGALRDRTRIVVAHRASTAARAHTVVWLEEGAVRAGGTHAELWQLPGYRALFAPDAVAAHDGRAA
ncbi:MAG TPA: ABC transporter ATP-binding protein [Solirubrobacteraceae bacterium]|nr:ABC transporter ATP-binding protein [Solirubrobacteraceae bacterium]